LKQLAEPGHVDALQKRLASAEEDATVQKEWNTETV
jgi:epoxyqueuosine reductase